MKNMYGVCVCVCDWYACGTHIWRSEDNSVEPALSFPIYMSSKDQTQVFRFVGQTPTSTEPSLQLCPRKYDFKQNYLLKPSILLYSHLKSGVLAYQNTNTTPENTNSPVDVVVWFVFFQTQSSCIT